jgi:CPA1 family monovalent cation:H+ antiporter
MFSFTIQSLIFLLVGLDFRSVYDRISSIPLGTLTEYVISVVAAVILGRFIWVYGFVITLPRLLSPSLRKKDPYPPWQYSFIISWSGMRGGISLAAALAIPTLTLQRNNIDLRDLLVFLVLSVIFVTLVLQGLSLPYILRKMGIDKVGHSERQKEHLSELQTRVQMINAALNWLHQQKAQVKNNKHLLNELSLHISEYQLLKNQYESRILKHNHQLIHDEQTENIENLSLLCHVIEVEKEEVLKLWRENKINLRMRNKLIVLLDHQIERYTI